MNSALRTRRRRWPAVLALLLLGGLLAAAMALYAGIDHLASLPVTVVIDGDEVVRGVDLSGVSSAHKLLAVAGVLCALLIVALVVPLTLMLVALLVGLVLVVSLGVPLLAVALVLAVAGSPLLLVGLLLWWALRSPRRAVQSPSATIRA